MKLLVAVGVVLAVGCGDSAKDVIAKHEAKATPVLEQLKALGPVIAKQPPITETAWQLPSGVTLASEPKVYGEKGGSPNPAYNLGVTFDHYVEKLCDSEPASWRAKDLSSGSLMISVATGEEWLLDPACYLTKGKPWWVTDMPENHLVEDRLSQFERTQYVAVIRLRDNELPGLIMKEIEDRKIEHFEPGHMRGDVVVYELATAKFLGGFPLDAKLPETVEVRSSGMHDQLKLQLMEQADKTIRYELGKVAAVPVR